MFASFLFFRICIFSQEKNHLSVLSPSPAGSVWTAVPSPQPQSLGVPQAPAWCSRPTAHLCPLPFAPAPPSLVALAPGSGLPEATPPERVLGRSQAALHGSWSCPCGSRMGRHLVRCRNRKGLWEAERKGPRSRPGRALEETVCRSVRLPHLRGDLGPIRPLP